MTTKNGSLTLAELFLQYTLTVLASSNGNTNPAAGAYQYNAGTQASIQATANSGYMFANWLRNNINVGSANPYLLTMDANYELTAVFELEPLPIQYTLTVLSSSNGNTNPAAGAYQYNAGTQASIQATANSGYIFANWLRNNINVGSANPYLLTMDANYELTAVFELEPANPPILEDGFETGTFSAWTTTTPTSGETAAITTSSVYEGSYAARFSSNGGGSYEKAYLTKALSPALGTVNVQGVFMLSQNGIVENNDRIKLVELRSGSTIIAAAGLREVSGTLRWWIETRDGTTYVETYAQATIDLSSWFTMEIQWTNDASNGGAILKVNGLQVIQVSGDNTSNYGDCTQVRVGLAEIYNCAATTLSIDNIVISTGELV